MVQGQAGKGSARRPIRGNSNPHNSGGQTGGKMINERQKPYQTSKEEQELRWKLYEGRINFKEFERRYKKLIKAGKIIRSGRVQKDE